MPSVAPWLNINPVTTTLDALRGGAEVGLRQRQLSDEEYNSDQAYQAKNREFAANQNQAAAAASLQRNRLALESNQLDQAAQEKAATLALQRDKLIVDTTQAQQQLEATHALRQSQLKQAATTQAAKLQMEQKQLDGLNNYRDALAHNASDRLNRPQTVNLSTKGINVKLTPEQFGAYQGSVKKWEEQLPDDMPNESDPSFSSYVKDKPFLKVLLKNKPQPTDFMQNQESAADALTQNSNSETAGVSSKPEGVISRIASSIGDQFSSKPNSTAVKSPTSKVKLANQLASQHPDWTRQQIIDAVNQQ